MTLAAPPDLHKRLLAMVHAFEGGSVTGDFDGMTASWGPIQANLGQGTLQPILRRMWSLDPEGVRDIAPLLAVAIRHGHDALVDYFEKHVQWSGDRRYATRKAVQRFERLARLDAAHVAFAEAARPYLARAERDATRLGFVTERGLAFCMDVAIQNGGIRAGDHLAAYWERVTVDTNEEWERLKALAKAVSESSLPRWRQDVLSRKLTIAVGRGVVHGAEYRLRDDFGIRYWQDPEARTLALWRDDE